MSKFIIPILLSLSIMTFFSKKSTGNTKVNFLGNKLTDQEVEVIFHNGTEPPSMNKYFDNYDEGIYVDILNGVPLFLSTDKFNSGTGWPSFTKPISKDVLTVKDDFSLSMSRKEVRTQLSDIHLGHVFNDGPKDKGGLRYCINSSSMLFIPSNKLQEYGYRQYQYHFNRQKNQYAIFAGGCFWGVQEFFDTIKGVKRTSVGYTGGISTDANYRNITTGKTNHAEAIMVEFDPNIVSFQELVIFFFKIHDPTQLNRQGNDKGTQYRSAIFVINDEQRREAQGIIDKIDSKKLFSSSIKTKLETSGAFYEAEEYHQKYLERNPNGYRCHFMNDFQL